MLPNGSLALSLKLFSVYHVSQTVLIKHTKTSALHAIVISKQYKNENEAFSLRPALFVLFAC